MTDENYNTQITLKVDKAISYKSWWNLIEEKRSLPHAKSNKLPLALKPENKQCVTLKLSGRSFHVLFVSTSSFIRQRCIFYSASLPPFLRVCWISKEWNKTIHNHDKLRIELWLWDGHKGQHKLPKEGSLTYRLVLRLISQFLKGSFVCFKIYKIIQR